MTRAGEGWKARGPRPDRVEGWRVVCVARCRASLAGRGSVPRLSRVVRAVGRARCPACSHSV
eukprot:6198062-Pleurochrysis_carterae.AAC.1